MNWHRFKALVPWLCELRMLAFALVYVLLGFVLIYCFGATERAIRLVGLFLQLLGISTVIWGITQTRAQFGHPPIWIGVAAWFRRCPIVPRSAYIQCDAVVSSASVVGGRLASIFTAKPEASIEERISHIENGLSIIQTRIANAEEQMDREFSAADGKLEVEVRGRKEGDQNVLKQLEASSTGGITISAIGALWLFVGVLLSSASPEIADWWK